MPDIELRGSRVLVLGGSGVLGGHIARMLHDRGATVALSGRDASRLNERADSIGERVAVVPFDLLDGSPEELIELTIEVLGGLDGVVNAAGVVAFGPLADITDDVLHELVEVDFAAPLRVIRTALPHLASGFVVSISGVVAEQPVPGMAAYSAVKSALSAATLALAKELRRAGVHVLDARPPHTETGLADRPVAGTAPRMPTGLDPATVAATIVDGLESARRELPAEAFTSA